ncbi:hypothetical protein [Candidatus Finniella inopinata]|uniref:Uncharacterized protein n=1 Tax=Candidatus Finniella inopinata TaxID=1696036 RepID=A0A4Q7DJ33_9PROT|nr:hypothetical protein [Candidatus Finniella inopinata]RZI46145.1 hypothetical protein EQU50_04210 [Candidatus Finniella inopinata]
MQLITRLIIYFIIGGFQSLYAEDLPEKPESRTDIKIVSYYTPEAREESEFKKTKKIYVRHRSVSPYRGFALVNLAATTSIRENNNFESESTNDEESEGTVDEGIIEVAYAKELLNQNIKPMAPTLIDCDRW